jgi:glyoxylase-like metal-dependent hydrolase (beta-lactamase superfamily II)
MRATEHGSHLVQLERLGVVSCFLVREEDGFTLVDTNLSGNATAIMALAEERGAPIVRIALTHGHADHVGSLDALHEALPDASVAIGEREQRLVEEERRLDPDEPQAKVRGSWPTIETPPGRTVVDGDRVGSLLVVATPGHTPGHVSYFDERDGTLVAGDAITTKGGIAVAGKARPLFPFPAFGTWHRPTAVESARRLLALEPRRLATGHGPVLEEPSEAIRSAIAAAE